MKKNYGFLFTALIIFTFFGCEETPTSESYRRVVVIDGTLTAGKNIDTVKVSWTGETDKYYNLKDLAINNAIVVVKGVNVPFYDSLIYDPLVPGRYFSKDSTKKILPAKTYELYVKTVTPEIKIVTATTTVPDTFSITDATVHNADTVRYNPFEPVKNFSWSASKFYSTYLPTITYLDSNPAMIPKIYYRDTVSKDFQRPEKVGYRIGLPPQQQNTELPWIFLSYFGNVQFDVYAIDFNSSDFINQAIPAQGGELKEIRYQTRGGIGVFGSRTVAKNPIKIYLIPL